MRILKYLLFFMVSLPFAGCEKSETFNNTEDRVGHSRVTFFADITLQGPEVMSIVKGTTFSDPGAAATEKGATIPVTVSGTVNTNETGLYTVNYTAINKEGFPQSIARVVIVIPTTEVPGTDLSGNYSQVGAENNTTVTKVGEGAYFMANMNHPLSPIGAYFICTDGINIIWPTQPTPYGEMSGSGTFNPSTKIATWTIEIPSASYVRTRTFQRL